MASGLPDPLPRRSPRSSPALVSIGIPVFQKQTHLEETLEAVLGQDHQNLEVILADNGSTDATGELCRRFAERDRRVRFLPRRTNIGSRRNFNFVFELAQGEFFCWNRGHDVPARDYLSRGLALLQAHPGAVLWHARCHEIDAQGLECGPVHEMLDTRGFSLPDRLRSVWRYIVGPATFGLIRAEAMQRTRLYQEIAGCDIVFLLELAVQGAFVFDPATSLAIRRLRTEHSEEESVRRTWEQLNPFRIPTEPPEQHVLQFLECHLRVLCELALAVPVKNELVHDLFEVYAAKFLGSIVRALDSLAERIEGSAPAPGGECDLDLATALLYLRRVDLGLLLHNEHEAARQARTRLAARIEEMCGRPPIAPDQSRHSQTPPE